MKETKKLLLFDIDGTLLISGGAGNRALNRALQRQYGISRAMESIIPDGKTDPAIIREIFQKNLQREPNIEEIENLCHMYLDNLRDEIQISSGYRLLPGVLPLLERAGKRSDLLMGLLTGNLERGAELKLGRSQLNRFFLFGGFGSDSEDRGEIAKMAVLRGREYAGEQIPLDRIFVIGDTVFDIQCARTVGAKALAVATGSTSFEELSFHRPDYLMENFSDLEDFWAVISEIR